MTGEVKKSVTISKNNAGFPPYLDWNRMRAEGIDYLGKLSGKIWTDHNVHDPGITILEVLCYALLDLGYRTHLPVEDILAKNPSLAGPEDNFFTPAQILTNNPLTINDYRKLLIDIPGIRNAWLEPAMDIKDICRTPAGRNIDPANHDEPGRPAANLPAVNTGGCLDFLNGIYHVYIETEVDVDKDFKNDDPDLEEKNKQDFIQKITGEVRKVLMAHRNLCEDFADIYILCKLETGVCATIEIEDGASAEEVYVQVANQLRRYFSASPAFYTLDQMLDRGTPIEDIFAGRPYSEYSHGFIDTAELDTITLKKEIHTSDIYHSIFDVEGVRKVSRLKFRNCGKPCLSVDGKKNTEWVIHLPENHIPVFSLSCSGFEFTRNGLPVSIDLEKFNSLIEMSWLHNGKIRYKMPSAYLDAPLPRGNFMPDLADYYSIQNDFPAVYGIGEGELGDDATDQRKAQALQLKGYLMFFDQLLANYLSQLQNIRQLFSFVHPADPKSQHSYFLNTMSTVPEMDKLLRFGQGNGLGPAGTVLAFPVAKNTWDLTDFTLQNAAAILGGFAPFTFNSLLAVYEASDLLRNDLVNEGESNIVIKSASDGRFLYAIVSSTDEFVMVGKKDFASLAEAEKHASSVQYAGVFENNYTSFIISSNNFTFNLELTLNTYTDYLGILVESEDLYLKRRKDFLSHLLSRFAEQFTDFVIYNWKSAMGVTDIYAAEQYLTQYPDLSRNRGKAFNYLLDGFINDNVSGFEKKVKAIAGIFSYKKNYLCHFVVEPFDETYFFDKVLFEPAAADTPILSHLTGREVNNETGFVYRLVDKNHIPAVFSLSFSDKTSALGKRKLLGEMTRKQLDRIPEILFDSGLAEAVPPGYRYIITFSNIEGLPGKWVLFKSVAVYSSEALAVKAFNDHYMEVLQAASDLLSYGDYIVLEQDPPTSHSIAFVPTSTKDALENAFNANWKDLLVKIVNTWPVKIIDETSLEFAQIFCKEYIKPLTPAKDLPEHRKYYFSFPVDNDINGEWTSTSYFDTPGEAVEEYLFFRMLTGYAGNYFVDCACNAVFGRDKELVNVFSYKLFIREVLAQGVDIFKTADEAWGPLGVEKFICAAQLEEAFWKYRRKANCYSFYVTCGNSSWVHPCSYDSEELRKKVISVLLEEGIDFISKQSFGFSLANGTLSDGEGKPFAVLERGDLPARDLCDLFILVAEQLNNGEGKTRYTQQGFLRHDLKSGITLQSTEQRQELPDEEIKKWIIQWEQQLRLWSCYFPITRTGINDNVVKGETPRYKYCIEIKLPGFNDCFNPKTENGRINMENRRVALSVCQVAWKSSCCFASCAEAMAALEQGWKDLVEKKNFRMVFDCDDHTYGIAFHSFNPVVFGKPLLPGKAGDIIAVNPQCYPTEQEDCKAVERAFRLVNIQGMHLIEHILLRPFKEADCRCRKKLAACGTDCDFPHWIQESECEGNDIHVCFKPGTDPYSFIATVILPAWGNRFRKEKERKIFEHLLYREAPAHVLLRIIWLRPLDFCRLESVYVEWERWMAGAYTCNRDFSLCHFIDLLFSTYYDCLPVCVDCLPCKDPETPKPGCWDDEKDRQKRPYEFIDQINELYCFEDYCRTRDQRPEGREKPAENPDLHHAVNFLEAAAGNREEEPAITPKNRKKKKETPLKEPAKKSRKRKDNQ